jgi:hypothetical protein
MEYMFSDPKSQFMTYTGIINAIYNTDLEKMKEINSPVIKSIPKGSTEIKLIQHMEDDIIYIQNDLKLLSFITNCRKINVPTIMFFVDSPYSIVVLIKNSRADNPIIIFNISINKITTFGKQSYYCYELPYDKIINKDFKHIKNNYCIVFRKIDDKVHFLFEFIDERTLQLFKEDKNDIKPVTPNFISILTMWDSKETNIINCFKNSNILILYRYKHSFKMVKDSKLADNNYLILTHSNLKFLSEEVSEEVGTIDIANEANSLIWDYHDVKTVKFKFENYEQLFKMAYEKYGIQNDNFYCAFVICNTSENSLHFLIKISSPKILEDSDIKSQKFNTIFPNDNYYITQIYAVTLI